MMVYVVNSVVGTQKGLVGIVFHNNIYGMFSTSNMISEATVMKKMEI